MRPFNLKGYLKKKKNTRLAFDRTRRVLIIVRA